MLEECGMKEHGILPMFAFAILEEMALEMKTNPSLRAEIETFNEFEAFVDTRLKPLTTLREGDYGGPVPFFARL
jgi:hypothetical protein